MSKIDVTKLDLYGLLELPPDASEQEIRTAYRKKALKVHPDKNPDNPDAAQLFHQLSEAFKVLTDETAKRAYDRVLKARKESELRNRQLDSKRRKLKDDLEARERAHQAGGGMPKDNRTPEEQLKAEIERLKKQGSSQLAEEQERIKRELAQEREHFSTARIISGKLKITWKVDPTSHCPYTEEELHKIMHKYGDISGLVVSVKKPGSAIVEFANKRDAEAAFLYEKGKITCPLTLSWINSEQPTFSNAPPPPQSQAQAPKAATSMADFEALVLQNMLRKAQEGKRKLEAATSPQV